MMRVYKGAAALSGFRKNELLHQLREIDRSIQDISAEYIHFVDVAGKLSSSDAEKLRKILAYDTLFDGSADGMHLLVVRGRAQSPLGPRKLRKLP